MNNRCIGYRKDSCANDRVAGKEYCEHCIKASEERYREQCEDEGRGWYGYSPYGTKNKKS